MENEELEHLFKKLEPKKIVPASPNCDPKESAKTSDGLKQLKRIAPFVIAIFFLVLAFQKNSPAVAANSGPREHLLSLVPMIPIPKGQNIPSSLLRVVAIDPKQLSKIQIQGLLLEHDLDGLAEKIRAKRTLAPGRPIFWKDLELEPKNIQLNKPSVTFAKETP